MEPRIEKPKESKFESLADFLFEKIIEAEDRKYETDAEKVFAFNRIFDQFLDFTEQEDKQKEKTNRIQIILKLKYLLKEERIHLPGKFERYLIDSAEKKNREEKGFGFIPKLNPDEFNPFFGRYDDDLKLKDQPDSERTDVAKKIHDLADRISNFALKDNSDFTEGGSEIDDVFTYEERKRINELANKISEFTLNSSLADRLLNFEGRAFRFINKLFKDKSNPVKKELLVAAINEAVRYIMTMPGSSDEKKDKKLIKKAQILGKIAIIIKLNW